MAVESEVELPATHAGIKAIHQLVFGRRVKWEVVDTVAGFLRVADQMNDLLPRHSHELNGSEDLVCCLRGAKARRFPGAHAFHGNCFPHAPHVSSDRFGNSLWIGLRLAGSGHSAKKEQDNRHSHWKEGTEFAVRLNVHGAESPKDFPRRDEKGSPWIFRYAILFKASAGSSSCIRPNCRPPSSKPSAVKLR